MTVASVIEVALYAADNLVAGAAIVLLESSAIHADGIFLAREPVERSRTLTQRYSMTARCFGDALLTPTLL